MTDKSERTVADVEREWAALELATKLFPTIWGSAPSYAMGSDEGIRAATRESLRVAKIVLQTLAEEQ